MESMMGTMNISNIIAADASGYWSTLGLILGLIFWAGVFLLAVYIVSRAKDDIYKTYLIAGLGLVIGSLLLACIFGGFYAKGAIQTKLKENVREMMNDEDVKKDFKNMMKEDSEIESDTNP